MKKNRLFLIGIFLLTLSGCGKQGNNIIEEIQDAVQVISVEQSAVENLSKFPGSKEELYELSLEEFRELIEECLPNYREFFKVSEELVLEDADWENFRTILSLKLFGSTITEEITETEPEDPNAIYTNPSRDYIESMSDDELIEYLTGLQNYLYPGNEFVDYSGLTGDELKEIKDVLLKGTAE